MLEREEKEKSTDSIEEQFYEILLSSDQIEDEDIRKWEEKFDGLLRDRIGGESSSPDSAEFNNGNVMSPRKVGQTNNYEISTLSKV